MCAKWIQSEILSTVTGFCTEWQHIFDGISSPCVSLAHLGVCPDILQIVPNPNVGSKWSRSGWQNLGRNELCWENKSQVDLKTCNKKVSFVCQKFCKRTYDYKYLWPKLF